MSRRHARARATNSRSTARVVVSRASVPNESPSRARRPTARTNKYATTSRAREALDRDRSRRRLARGASTNARAGRPATNHAASWIIIHRAVVATRLVATRTHTQRQKKQEKKPTTRRADERTTDVPRRRRRHAPPPPPSPRAVFDAHTRTDRPRASDRPRVRPTARSIVRPTDRPPLFFFFSPSVRRAPIARVRACAREKIESRPTARSMTSA